MQVWVDKVSIECNKCKSIESFDVLLGVGSYTDSSVSVYDIVDAIRDNYADEDGELNMFNKGRIRSTSDGYSFTCSKCLKKAVKARKQKANAKKKGNLTEHIVGKRIK